MSDGIIPISERLTRRFADYSKVHQTAGNLACHWLGIPLIVLGLFGLLSSFAWAPWLLWGIGVAIYAVWDFRWAIAFAPVLLGFLFLAQPLSLGLSLLIFVMGWISQLVGHGHFEKQRPAFLENLSHLLIGPLWLYVKLIEH